MLREACDGLRERLAALDRRQHAGEHFLALAVAFLLGERLQRLDQVEARVEERHELHREERGRKALAARGEGQAHAAALERDHVEALTTRRLGGERRIRRLQRHADDLLARIERENLEPHRPPSSRGLRGGGGGRIGLRTPLKAARTRSESRGSRNAKSALRTSYFL